MNRDFETYPVEQVNVHELFRIVRKRRLTIAVVTALVLVVVYVAAMRRAPAYWVEATVRINPFTLSTMMGDKSEGVPIGALYDILSQASGRSMDTLAAILTSPDVLEAVIQSPGKDPKTGRDRVFYSDPKKVKVTANKIEGTTLLRITVIWQSALDAANLANALVDKANNLRQVECTGALMKALEYIGQQKVDVKQKMEVAEKALTDFKQRHNAPDMASTVGKVTGQVADYEASRAGAMTALAAANASLSILRNRLKSINPSIKTPTTTNNPLVQNLKSQLTQLELDKLSLSTKYTPKHKKMIELDGKIKAYQDRLQTEQPIITSDTKEETNPLYQQVASQVTQLEGEMMAQQARLSALNQFAAQKQKELEGLPKMEQQYARLSRDYGTHNSLYSALVQQEMMLQLEQSRQVEPSTVISLASAEKAQQMNVSPRVLLMVGLLGGLVFGLAMALFQEYMADTIDTEEHIQRHLELPLLGAIPRIGDPKRRIIYKLPGSTAEVEGYRFLSTNIPAQNNGRTERLLFTSTGSGSGNSTTALNLAVSMAERGKRVILLDMDLRKPSLHRHFNAMPSPGVSDVLLGEKSIEDVLLPTENDHLIFVPGGSMLANPVPLLSSPKLREMLDDLSGLADMVMIDTPPCITVVDATLIAPEMDGTVLVIGAGKTARKAARRARVLLENVGAKIVGVILNRSGEPTDSSYYYYQPQRSQRKSQQALPQGRGKARPASSPESKPEPPSYNNPDLNKTQILSRERSLPSTIQKEDPPSVQPNDNGQSPASPRSGSENETATDRKAQAPGGSDIRRT